MENNSNVMTLSRRTITIIGSAVLVPVVVISAIACSGGSPPAGASSENTDSGSIWTHYQDVQPPYQPTGDSAYRANENYVQAIHVLGLNTTSFFWQAGRDTPYFWCPSYGGALSDEAEATNPDFVEPDPNNNYNQQNPGSIIIDNMDPDGVYPPTSGSTGTDVLCETASGAKYDVYAEGDVTQISAPAEWVASANGGKGGIVVTGAPVMPVCTVDEYQGQAATLCTDPATGKPAK
jgi:hypothetical protein